MAERATIMRSIVSGLKLLDQVYIWIPRLAGEPPNQPSEVVEQKGDTLVAKYRDPSSSRHPTDSHR
jgi:hypothetical protein